jgi:hypothetical protein
LAKKFDGTCGSQQASVVEFDPATETHDKFFVAVSPRPAFCQFRRRSTVVVQLRQTFDA